MIKNYLSPVAVLLAMGILITASASYAEDTSEIKAVRAELSKFVDEAKTAEIIKAPVDGVYRIEVSGSYAYAYVDGDFVLFGDLYNTKDKVSLGEDAKNQRMAKLISEVPESKMIVFGPKNPKRYITVFTDIDCGYCRKLHNEVAELNDAGIQVRYLAFPRSGIGQASYNKYVSVWCSEDQQSALTAAKAGESTSGGTKCDNPIAETYKLGQEVGVRGTPTIIFDDGKVTPGYLPAVALISQLGLDG